MAVPKKKLAALVRRERDVISRLPALKESTTPPPTTIPPQEGDDDEEEEGMEPDIDVEAVSDMIDAGDGDEELIALSKSIDPEKTPPEWADHELWEEAEEAVEEWGGASDFYTVVTHVYKMMGGDIRTT